MFLPQFYPKKTIENPYPVCSSFIRKYLKNNIKINTFIMERKNINMRNPFCTRNGRKDPLFFHMTLKSFFSFFQECLSLLVKAKHPSNRNRSDLRYFSQKLSDLRFWRLLNNVMACNSVMGRCYGCSNKYQKMLTIPNCTILLIPLLYHHPFNLIINGRFSFTLHIFNNHQHIIKKNANVWQTQIYLLTNTNHKTTPNQ